MKYITDRQEIAKAINFGKYPVLTLNRENRPFAKEHPECDYATGCRVRVAWDHENPRYKDMTTHGKIYIEDGRIAISGDCSVLKSDFGYSDVIEMASEANTPIVHKGQTVVVIEDWPSQRMCKVRLMKVSERINIHCSTVAMLEDLPEDTEI